MTSSSIKVAVALLAAGVALAPQAKTWKGMIYDQPGLSTESIERQRFGLAGFSTCSVLTENLTAEVKDTLTASDVDEWTSNRLKNMGISVRPRDELRVEYMGTRSASDEGVLRAADRVRSCVYVVVNVLKCPTTGYYGNISVEVQRAGFIQPGYFETITIYGQSAVIHTGPDTLKSDIRDTLNGLLDQMEKDWKTSNP